jgi:predicted RNA-binding Zn-ribbon protein involved in translation (DUF1610 family)
MPNVRVVSTSPLVQRSCLCCGYRGDELQVSGERAAYRCPNCGQDLYARPPRSYAEMEGLQVQLPGSPAAPRRVRAQRLGFIRRALLMVLQWVGIVSRPPARGSGVSPQVRRPGVPRAGESRRP